MIELWPECGDTSLHVLQEIPKSHLQLLWLLGACRDPVTGMPNVAEDGHLVCLPSWTAFKDRRAQGRSATADAEIKKAELKYKNADAASEKSTGKAAEYKLRAATQSAMNNSYPHAPIGDHSGLDALSRFDARRIDKKENKLRAQQGAIADSHKKVSATYTADSAKQKNISVQNMKTVVLNTAMKDAYVFIHGEEKNMQKKSAFLKMLPSKIKSQVASSTVNGSQDIAPLVAHIKHEYMQEFDGFGFHDI